MATIVQSKVSAFTSLFGGGVTASLTFDAPTNSANTIVAVYACGADSRTISSVSDGTSNLTEAVDAANSGASSRCAIHFIAPGAARSTITWTISSSTGSEAAVAIFEVSGLDPADLLEAVNSNAPSPTTSHPTGLVAANAGILFTAAMVADGVPLGPDADFTYLLNTNSDFSAVAIGYRVVASAGSYQQTLTTGTSERSLSVIAALNDSAAPAVPLTAFQPDAFQTDAFQIGWFTFLGGGGGTTYNVSVALAAIADNARSTILSGRGTVSTGAAGAASGSSQEAAANQFSISAVAAATPATVFSVTNALGLALAAGISPAGTRVGANSVSLPIVGALSPTVLGALLGLVQAGAAAAASSSNSESAAGQLSVSAAAGAAPASQGSLTNSQTLVVLAAAAAAGPGSFVRSQSFGALAALAASGGLAYTQAIALALTAGVSPSVIASLLGAVTTGAAGSASASSSESAQATATIGAAAGSSPASQGNLSNTNTLGVLAGYLTTGSTTAAIDLQLLVTAAALLTPRSFLSLHTQTALGAAATALHAATGTFVRALTMAETAGTTPAGPGTLNNSALLASAAQYFTAYGQSIGLQLGLAGTAALTPTATAALAHTIALQVQADIAVMVRAVVTGLVGLGANATDAGQIGQVYGRSLTLSAAAALSAVATTGAIPVYRAIFLASEELRAAGLRDEAFDASGVDEETLRSAGLDGEGFDPA